MKKTNELDDEEIKAIREKFRQKHNRSILFQRNDIFSCFKKTSVLETSKPSVQQD